MHADQREEIGEVRTDGIVAAVGLKMMATGDTLCAGSHPVRSETLEFPSPSSSLPSNRRGKPNQQMRPTFRGRIDVAAGKTVP